MDEVELLRDIGASVPLEDDEARSRARARLEARIAQEFRPTPRGSARTRRRRVLVAASIAALVVAAMVIQAILPPGAGGPNPASATLNELAAVAAAGEAPLLSPGQYLYVRTTGVISQSDTSLPLGKSWTFVVRVIREKWIAADGSGRILERFGRPRFATPEDREIWLKAGSRTLLPHGHRYDTLFGPGELDPRDLGALPLDPGSLARLIASGGATGTAIPLPHDPLDTIADLLSEVPATPELRSALFRATAHLVGVVTRPDVLDPLGRIGIGVTAVRSRVRTELIFDPKSSALLARIVTSLDADGNPIQVLERSTYVERRVVDSSTSRDAIPRG